jgi:Ni/Fe-hydrogenase subunit HybB-like protein
MLTYIVIMEWSAFRQRRRGVRGQAVETRGAEVETIGKATRYLLGFLVAAISLELLDLIFRGYTAMKSWDILRSVMYGKDFVNIFILQYGLGNLVPLVLLLLPGRTIRRTVLALLLVLFGVFMMRWNVVIGGQAFSLSFAGYMHYHIPVIPHSVETFKEGVLGALSVAALPFVLFAIINRYVPSLRRDLEIG